MIHYAIEKQGGEIWLRQKKYEPRFALKTESVFAQCNGYMGVRASLGLPSLDGKKGCLLYTSQVEQERQDVVQAIIDDFEKENENIEVESIPVNEDDYDSKIVALGGSGELPAIIEYSQDQAKTSVSNQFTNLDAVKEVIDQKGEDSFYRCV